MVQCHEETGRCRVVPIATWEQSDSLAGYEIGGRGVREIRIAEDGQYRVLYLTRRMEEIVVLHAFEKKTRRTAKSDIDLGKQRLKSLK